MLILAVRARRGLIDAWQRPCSSAVSRNVSTHVLRHLRAFLASVIATANSSPCLTRGFRTVLSTTRFPFGVLLSNYTPRALRPPATCSVLLTFSTQIGRAHV